MKKDDEIKREKLGITEIVGIIIIVLMLLIFPYMMVTQHMADSKADSYYETK